MKSQRNELGWGFESIQIILLSIIWIIIGALTIPVLAMGLIFLPGLKDNKDPTVSKSFWVRRRQNM